MTDDANLAGPEFFFSLPFQTESSVNLTSGTKEYLQRVFRRECERVQEISCTSIPQNLFLVLGFLPQFYTLYLPSPLRAIYPTKLILYLITINI